MSKSCFKATRSLRSAFKLFVVVVGSFLASLAQAAPQESKKADGDELSIRARFLYVRFNSGPGNAFYRAISGRNLSNGRPVDRVILPDGEHGTHFHLEF